MQFAARILFGADSSFGLAVYLSVSLIFGEKFNLYVLIFSVFCAHLPDLDMVPFILFKKYATRRSHWVFGHHPLLLTPAAAAAAYFAGEKLGLNSDYLATIAGAGVFLHFLHDTMEPQGLHWLSPFRWYPHITLEWKWDITGKFFRGLCLFHRDRKWVDDFFAAHVRRTGNFSGSREFSDRISGSKSHISIFVVLCLLTINFALTLTP